MVLYLIVGDLHIPYRASEIDPAFKKMFVPGKINHIFVTGNLVSKETHEYLKSICSDVTMTRGDYDEYATDIPEVTTTTLGSISFGMVHGHQVVPWGDKESLAMWCRKLDCDVLISGGTHQQKVFELDGRFYVNPGSLTGACSPFESDVTPSFVLLDVNGPDVVAFIYMLEDGEVKVRKKEFKKAN
eukprot:PhM_4_TR11786/c0_g1_i1/m.102052/K18467/VPS29; vacuolar protein sorting-associated protein 29